MINKILFKEWFVHNDFLLLENWEAVKRKFINTGFAENLVNQYIDAFRILKNRNIGRDILNAPIQTLEGITNRKDINQYRTFEQIVTFVDFAGPDLIQQQPEPKAEEEKEPEKIETDGETIYEDDHLSIKRGDTPNACIRYKGNEFNYDWCVSRPINQGNMYYTYRYSSEERTFYFVKNKDRTRREFETNPPRTKYDIKDPYHFFVLQVLKPTEPTELKYRVTSSKNLGDIMMTWQEIEQIEPLLRGKKELFKFKEIDPEERLFNQTFKHRNPTLHEFALLNDTSKRQYMALQLRPLPDELFDILSNELQLYYINTNAYALTENQFDKTSNPNKKRYIDLNKFQLSTSMFENMSDKLKRHYIDASKHDITNAQYNSMSDDLKEYYTEKIGEIVKNKMIQNPEYVLTPRNDLNNKIIIDGLLDGTIPINIGQYTQSIIEKICQLAHNNNVLQEMMMMIIQSKNDWERRMINFFIKEAPNAAPVIHALRNNLSKLNDEDITNLSVYSRDVNGVIDNLQQAPEILKGIDIKRFCRHKFVQQNKRKNCDGIILAFIRNREEMDSEDVFDCLYNSFNVTATAEALNARNPEFIDDIKRDKIKELLSSRRSPTNLRSMATALGEDNINKLTLNDIATLVDSSIHSGEQEENDITMFDMAKVLGINNIRKLNDPKIKAKYPNIKNNLTNIINHLERR